MTATEVKNWTVFRASDLDEMLGHRPDLYDVEGIIKNATMVNPRTHSRYWKVFGDELDELIWFHEYEIVSPTDNVSGCERPVTLERESETSITELICDDGYPRYIADEATDTKAVVRAAEATLLSADVYYTLLKHGLKGDSALSNTLTLMHGVLMDKDLVRV